MFFFSQASEPTSADLILTLSANMYLMNWTARELGMRINGAAPNTVVLGDLFMKYAYPLACVPVCMRVCVCKINGTCIKGGAANTVVTYLYLFYEVCLTTCVCAYVYVYVCANVWGVSVERLSKKNSKW